jgi:hypothetical protein
MDAPAASDAAGDRADGPTRSLGPPRQHRAAHETCIQPRPPGQPGNSCDSIFDDAGSNCGTDLDCTGGLNGRCSCTPLGSYGVAANLCTYDECQSDDDCHGKVCQCREDETASMGQLSSSNDTCFGLGNCQIDSDCGPGGYCSPGKLPGCDTWYGFFCHTAGDECANDDDCPQANAYCAYDLGASRWICSTGMCPDG